MFKKKLLRKYGENWSIYSLVLCYKFVWAQIHSCIKNIFNIFREFSRKEMNRKQNYAIFIIIITMDEYLIIEELIWGVVIFVVGGWNW